jgi:flagellar basal body-associated protein FliL
VRPKTEFGEGLPSTHFGQLTKQRNANEGGRMGLLELLLIILIVAAIGGGIGVSPLLWLLLVVALVIFLTGGGFGYRRGGRI